MITSYDELKKGFNPYAPKGFSLPDTASDQIELSDDSLTLKLELTGSDVTKITLITRDIEGSFYPVFVNGLEKGMGFASMNYYHAMMKTIEQHNDNLAVNNQGIKALHSWQDGLITVTMTKD